MPVSSLSKYLDALEPVEISGPRDFVVSGIGCDSRQITSGSIFFALRGGKQDGNRFIRAALERGVGAVVTDVEGIEVPPSVSLLRVRDARQALARAANLFFDFPTRDLRLVGITGTNGKTTTAYLVESIFRTTGECTGMIGTIEYRLADQIVQARNTTPESVDLQRMFAELRAQGCRYAAMEVSSHALEMHRVDGCQFAVAVFTNLTRDHLDFHQTFENYFGAKKKLFLGADATPPPWAVLNVDDERGVTLVHESPSQKLRYAIREPADVRATAIEYSFEGLKITAETPRGLLHLDSLLVGETNVYNILAAVATAIAMDFDVETIQRGIHMLHSVPGRFEKISCGQPFAVVVDYAHTDDALRHVIQAARRLARQRVITVFGCGGDRDRTKRPLMGEVAGKLSDITILTSDNPRTEDPLRIIADAVVGLQRATHRYVVEPDRAKAIQMAIEEAHDGDIVLLTGKGHETYQVIGEQSIHFDDREVARTVLTQLGYDPAKCN